MRGPDKVTEYTLAELANALQGRLLDASHASVRVQRVRGISESDELSLSYIEDVRAVSRLTETARAAAFLVPATVDECTRPAIAVRNPRRAFAQALVIFYPRTRPPAGVHPTASVHPLARIAASASIGPFCTIGEEAFVAADAVLHAHCHIGAHSEIGNATELRPRVHVNDRVVVGAHCLIHANTTLGAALPPVIGQGPGAASPTVIIGENVEIGARVTVEAGIPTPTRIESGTKTDNQVTIGASACVGPHCLLVSKSQVGRNAVLEHHVTLAGQALVMRDVRVGAITIVGGRGKIEHDLPPRSVVSGEPAEGHKDALRRAGNAVKLAHLVDAMQRILRHDGGS